MEQTAYYMIIRQGLKNRVVKKSCGFEEKRVVCDWLFWIIKSLLTAYQILEFIGGNQVTNPRIFI